MNFANSVGDLNEIFVEKCDIPYYEDDHIFNENMYEEFVGSMESGNFKEKLKTLMESYEFNGYTSVAAEYFASFYREGDSGDEELTDLPVFHKPNKKPVDKKALHRRHRAHTLKDKQKHGKCEDWFSPEYIKRETNKRTRKEFILPSGKKGYKKMMNDWFIC